jgi:xylulokinase
VSDLILGIDIGTTAMKAAVYDGGGCMRASAITEYSLSTPEVGFVEAPCGIYMDAIRACLGQIALGGMDLKDIAAIGFSAQGETLVFLDGDGQPLRDAIVWMDNRAGAQAEAMRAHFGDETCYRVTGQVSFEACWPAAKVMWVRENEPGIWAQTRHILLLEDYIIYRLTGAFAAEGSLLTSTLYWDITTKRYWPEMLAYLGIDETRLPTVMESGEPVGKVTEEATKALGLSPEALVCTGTLDQAAGAIGVGNIRPGIFSENIGAALAVCVPTAQLVYDPKRQMPVHYFPLPDTYMMHTFTTGGMCLRWFRDAFCGEEMRVGALAGEDPYAIMDREAARIPPGSDGMVCLPHLQGSMAPDVNLDAKGVFFGMTLKHTKAHFIRSIMESVGYIIARNLDTVLGMGLGVEEIRTLGGGAKSHVWNQMKADITGKRLVLAKDSQNAACLGAAILAGKGAGIFSSVETACDAMVQRGRIYEPDMETHGKYQAYARKYRELFAALGPVFAGQESAGN